MISYFKAAIALSSMAYAVTPEFGDASGQRQPKVKLYGGYGLGNAFAEGASDKVDFTNFSLETLAAFMAALNIRGIAEGNLSEKL